MKRFFTIIGVLLAFANKWLFSGLILKWMSNHTTIAPTIINAEAKQ